MQKILAIWNNLCYIDVNNNFKQKETMMSEIKSKLVYFNSYLERSKYGTIKDEAFRLGITTKEHVSGILSAYAELLIRKEESGSRREE